MAPNPLSGFNSYARWEYGSSLPVFGAELFNTGYSKEVEIPFQIQYEGSSSPVGVYSITLATAVDTAGIGHGAYARTAYVLEGVTSSYVTSYAQDGGVDADSLSYSGSGYLDSSERLNFTCLVELMLWEF